MLVVHHGRLPPAASEPDRPTTGGALRARWHVEALRGAGHEVIALGRGRDLGEGPDRASGYEDASDLLIRASALRPDRIIAVAPEEAPVLRALGAPLAVDLYAPRLLESAYEGETAREAATLLAALSAADVLFVSNPRQRLYWLGALAFLGFDLTVDPTRLVPIVAERGPARDPGDRAGDPPVLVGGGAAWAWQNPVPGLVRALSVLDARGEGQIVWYGGAPLLEGQRSGAWSLPAHPRLIQGGWLGRRAQLAAYARATLAIDWMAPNVERGLAFGFRHADYLGCGLPILTGPDTALTDWLDGAGWVGEGVEALLSAALDDPEERARRSAAAIRVAEGRLSLARASAPVMEWVEQGWRAPRSGPSLADRGALASEAARERALREAMAQTVARGEAEVAEKRAEVLGLNAQVAALTGIADRLARALDEVAGFKREAVTVLGHGLDLARTESRDAGRELAICRADLAKKNAELSAALSLQERLENDLRAAHAELERQRNKGLFRR